MSSIAAPRRRSKSPEIKKPSDENEFRSLLSSERQRFTRKLLEAGAWTLENPRVVALEPLAVIARESGIAPSTFVRLAKAMGFYGFTAMQKLFRAPLHGVYPESFSERIRHSQGDEVVADPNNLAALGQSLSRANSASLAHLNEKLAAMPLDSVVARLLDARVVHVVGLERSFAVATSLAYSLKRSGIQTIQITGMGSVRGDEAANMQDGDLLAAVSFPPYAKETIDIARQVREAGHPVIAITDSAVSPIAERASDSLLVEDAVLHGFRSLTAAMTLVQTLTIGVAYRKRRLSNDLDLDQIEA